MSFSDRIYRIHRWNETFLYDKAKGRKGKLKWLAVPVKLDDLDLIALAESRGGAAALGVWLMLLEVAGSLEARDGYLRRSTGDPLTLCDLSKLTRLPKSVLEKGIHALGEIGWLRSEPFGTVTNDAVLQDRTVQDKTVTVQDNTGVGIVPREAERAASAEAVCAYYNVLHPQAKPSDKTKWKIRARLAEGWSVEAICAAIDGNHRSPHHCGENDRGTKYHSLELIVRDSEHVQQFIEVPEMTPSTTAIKNRRVAENWVKLKERQDANG